jgi:hypothetical protein
MNNVVLFSRFRMLVGLVGALTAPLFVAACNGEDLGSGTAALTPQCVEDGSLIPANVWICGEARTVECDSLVGAHVGLIYTQIGAPTTCSDEELTVSQTGPFLVGPHAITVSGSINGAPAVQLCASTLTVVDTLPPVVTPHDSELWPPNHKLHHVSVADCVTAVDVCDGSLKVWLTSASSDEPQNDLGDGNTDPDIVNLGCDGVDLRAERQGTSDGRVYTLGFHVEDAAGHGVDGTCHVTVPHDQGGKGIIDSGPAYTVNVAPGTCQ